MILRMFDNRMHRRTFIFSKHWVGKLIIDWWSGRHLTTA